MQTPNLLIVDKLINPLSQAIDRIENIRMQKIRTSNSIVLEGLFVLSISSFEVSLIDCLKYYIYNFPEKLDKKIYLSKNDLLSEDIILKAIENKLNSIAYKRLKEILIFFKEITSIDGDTLLSDTIDSLVEAKARRNILLKFR